MFVYRLFYFNVESGERKIMPGSILWFVAARGLGKCQYHLRSELSYPIYQNNTRHIGNYLGFRTSGGLRDQGLGLPSWELRIGA